MAAGRGDITFAIAPRGTCEHAGDRPDRCARSHGSSCSRYPSLPSAPQPNLSPFPDPSSTPGNPAETSTAERRFLSGRHPDAHGCRQAQRPPTMTFLCRNPRRTPPLLMLPVPLISSHLRNSCSPALIDNALAVTTTPLRFLSEEGSTEEKVILGVGLESPGRDVSRVVGLAGRASFSRMRCIPFWRSPSVLPAFVDMEATREVPPHVIVPRPRDCVPCHNRLSKC